MGPLAIRAEPTAVEKVLFGESTSSFALVESPIDELLLALALISGYKMYASSVMSLCPYVDPGEVTLIGESRVASSEAGNPEDIRKRRWKSSYLSMK